MKPRILERSSQIPKMFPNPRGQSELKSTVTSSCMSRLIVALASWRIFRRLSTTRLVRLPSCRSCCSPLMWIPSPPCNSCEMVLFAPFSRLLLTVIESGICFQDVRLRVVSTDAKNRLVDLRDCSVEGADDVVKRFFSSFGEAHSVSRSCYQAFPDIFDGNRVIKITMTKDVPGNVSIAAFERHMCYRCQPASCAVCKKLGNRSRSSPPNGLCRRCCRQGHHDLECTNASVSGAGAAPETRNSAANPPCPASASPAANVVPDVPPRRSAEAEASVPVADPPDPVDAPAVQDNVMPDGEYVPSTDEDSEYGCCSG